MFELYFINFGYRSQDTQRTLEDAVAYARKVNYQCTIWDRSGQHARMVASYCPLAGVKYL